MGGEGEWLKIYGRERLGGIYEHEGGGRDIVTEDYSFGIGGGASKINDRAKIDKGEETPYYMTASRDIKIRCTGNNLIGSPLWNPMGVPYLNGDVASVIWKSFQKTRMYTVTWAVHNSMEE